MIDDKNLKCGAGRQGQQAGSTTITKTPSPTPTMTNQKSSEAYKADFATKYIPNKPGLSGSNEIPLGFILSPMAATTSNIASSSNSSANDHHEGEKRLVYLET